MLPGDTARVQLFLSTPSARRATVCRGRLAEPRSNFYPRPPRGGRPECGQRHFRCRAISIHALREEGDLMPAHRTTCLVDFYPRPPRGGRHYRPTNPQGHQQDFYPRPPRGGRPTRCSVFGPQKYFYPRPPRGGRLGRIWTASFTTRFLSTPSARRATGFVDLSGYVEKISIHALREEGDLGQPCSPFGGMDFYPRPPRGGRLSA